MPFRMWILKCGLWSQVTANEIAEEWGLFLIFAPFFALVKSNFNRSAIQSQPKMLLVFLP